MTEKQRRQRVLGVAAVLLVPLALVGLGRWLLDPVAFANRHLETLEKVAASVLERRLTVGAVEGHIYPELDVTVRDVVLAGADADAAPMLMVSAMTVRFQLRRALTSFGRELPVDAVRIDGVVLRARRDARGTIDVQEVVRRLPPLALEDLRGAVVSAFSIVHGEVHWIDDGVARGRELVVNDISLQTRGPVALGAPLSVSASAAWGDSERPATADVRVENVPDDLALWPPPVADVHLSLPRTDLASAITWLGLPPLFAGGVVDVGIDAHTSPLAIDGTLDVHGRALSAVVTTGAGAGAEHSGEVSDATLRSDVHIAVDGFRTELDNFAFHGAGIGIEGDGVFLAASIDGVESLDVLVRADELARLGLLIPPLRNTAPGALQLIGGGTGMIHASPDDLALELDLDAANIHIGEVISKPPGQRLRVFMAGARSSAAARVREVGSGALAPGRFDTAVRVELPRGVLLQGALVLQPEGVDVAFFDLVSNRTTLARAAASSPLVRDFVGDTFHSGALRAHLSGVMASENAFDFLLDARDLDVVAGPTTVGGSARIRVRAVTSARGLQMGLSANLDALSIVTVDSSAKPIFEKPAGSALTMQAGLVEAGGWGSLGRSLEPLDGAARQGAVFAGHGLSPRWRRFALGLNGQGSVRAAHAVLLGIDLDDADARVALVRGRLTLTPARVRALSGDVSFAGTVVDLRPEPPTWSMSLRAEDLDLARILDPIRVLTGSVEGTADAHAHLHGAGLSLETLLGSLDGPVTMNTHDVHIAAVDTLSGYLEKFWTFVKGLPGVSRTDFAKTHDVSLADSIREGEWSLTFHGTEFRLVRPMVCVTTLGILSVFGHAGFEGDIDLRARMDILPESAAGAPPIDDAADVETVPVEASITGTWAKPVFATSNFDSLIDAVARAIARAFVR